MNVREIGGGALSMPSWTIEGVVYETHPDSGYCTCPRYKNKDYCAKHPTLGEAIQRARLLRFGAKIAEENVIELCLRIFAPIKNETRLSASNLYWEVYTYRHSTERMKLEAYRRYCRVELLEGLRGKQAA